MPAASCPIDELLTQPLWRAEDLGRPIPDSPHAVSACLPTWRDNIGYEEQDPRVVQRLTTGYPRFVFNAICRELFGHCESRFAGVDEACLAFPSSMAAAECGDFVTGRSGLAAHVHQVTPHRVWVVAFPRRAMPAAKAFWQHAGIGISSRQADAILQGRSEVDAAESKRSIRERLAGLVGVSPDAVMLFPSGMAAYYFLHTALRDLFPGRKSVQFGFPYVDSLKIQQSFGVGVEFFPRGDVGDLAALNELAGRERLSSICTELPTNPLLTSPDLGRLAEIARRAECPLVVDDTVASCVNVDVLPVADVVWCSLTKYFSGRGDVTGGALIVNPASPFAESLESALARRYEDLLWCEDAVVLERNSRDFAARVPAINRSAEELARFLQQHPAVAAVHYPAFRSPEIYESFRRSGGGYGGLLSVELRDPEQNAPKFFDALQVCKGPNLGMNYTLACPFTILAHYQELDFAERCGVSRWLIRVSVGLEPVADLIARFDRALSGIPVADAASVRKR
jgi:cystathionine gamma-synthase